jgi:hypothetical protein
VTSPTLSIRGRSRLRPASAPEAHHHCLSLAGYFSRLDDLGELGWGVSGFAARICIYWLMWFPFILLRWLIHLSYILLGILCIAPGVMVT